MKRRHLLQGLLAAPLVWPLAGLRAAESQTDTGRRVVVVGAGAFGGWTALRLAQSGARVTLIESWAPGHPMASSGGRTRVIRHMYTNPLYVRMAARSMALYRQAQAEWHAPLFHSIGVLFLGQAASSDFFAAGNGALDSADIGHQRLSAEEVAGRWPQLNLDGIEHATYEAQSGYLRAQRACQVVAEAFEQAGGQIRYERARPGVIKNGRLASVALSDGSEERADDFVFACGPWLPELFADTLAPLLKTSRQEVYFFRPPDGDSSHHQSSLPVWADFGEELWYGIPANPQHGFKIANDARGATIEPETADRSLSAGGVAAARSALARRFPAMAEAPLINGHVCQYTNTPDGDFIIDRHPDATNLWLAGGGSGHGFKHGPALGELIAESVLSGQAAEPAFSLARFSDRS